MFFGRLRVQTKLAVLVLVPLIGVLALAVPVVLERVGEANRARQTADTVALADRVGSMLQEMQSERLLSVGYLLGMVEHPRLALQSAEVVDSVRDIADGLDVPVPAAMTDALRSAASLETTRAAVRDRGIRADQLISEYATVIRPIIDAVGLNLQADLTTSTGRQVLALDSVLRADEGINQTMSLLAVAVHSRNAPQIIQVSQKFSELQAEAQRFAKFATPEQVQLYVDVQNSFTARAGANFLEILTSDPTLAAKTLSVDGLFSSVESIGVLGRFIEKKITSDVTATVTESRNRATATAFAVSAVTLLLVLLVVALSLAVARAVARPLRRLTSSAERIASAAENELEKVADDEAETSRPLRLDPVDVLAKDEIGDLARAFERVQTTAVRLVERQVAGRRNVAQMFGHVGRRTQNLVGRQLALIDRLEQQETDSSRLRELYRLDHMSSRLRRSASSLVVLSGGAGANEYMAPMPLTDVVRLALGEIEDYTRVDVEIPDEAMVVPSVVGDLTLLLAELMENATSFSPPHSRVDVSAVTSGDGVRLAIIDHGLGLSDERLAEENARLTRRERLDLVPTEVLGLFVVGRLARRHGLTVALSNTAGGGLTASVDLRARHLVADREEALAAAHALAAPPAALPPGPGASPVDSTPAGPASGPAQPFDQASLTRASRTLETAGTWNAFAPRQPALPHRARAAAVGTAQVAAGQAGNAQVAAGPAQTALPARAAGQTGIAPVGQAPSPSTAPPTQPWTPSPVPAGPSTPLPGPDSSWTAHPAPAGTWPPTPAPTPHEAPARHLTPAPAPVGTWPPAHGPTALSTPHPGQTLPSTPPPAAPDGPPTQPTGPDGPSTPPAAPDRPSTPPAAPDGPSTPPAAPDRLSTPPAAPDRLSTPPAGPDGRWTPHPAAPWTAGQAPPRVVPVVPANPVEPATRPDPGAEATFPAPPAAAPAPAASIPRQRDGESRPALRRRVPGAQLPEDDGVHVLAPPAAAADADAARDLVQQFEAGVTRAHREAGGWEPGVRDAGVRANGAPGEPDVLRSGLTRRVPGATLSETTRPIRTTPLRPEQQLDPDEARNLIEQFESGVALALREARPHPHPEGRTR